MKKIIYILLAVFFLFASCATTPKAKKEDVKKPSGKTVTKKETPKKNAKPKEVEDEVIAEFDGVAITKKDKALAKSEIEVVVSKLNAITAESDYSGWIGFMSAEYKKEYSNPAVLKQVSKGLPGAAKGIQLKNLQDYFKFVFVPSRQNVRVDDIIYKSPTRVKVIKKDNGKSLIFYNLEKINNRWLLVP